MSDCPCGSGATFANCCEPFLSGARVPETAEQAMRARYAAYTRADTDYLMATLHPSNRGEGDADAARRWATRSQWLGLEILATEAGGADDLEGTVEFIARYRSRNGEAHAHHERSLFVKENGRWLFKDAQAPDQHTVRRESAKVRRNDPCPCGSGKKYKKCCEKG